MEEEKSRNQLAAYRQKITSQYGEGGVLEEISRRVGIIDENAWCVEFGAGGGGEYNTNTWHFINKRHWSAVLIESDPVYYKELPKNYQNRKDVFCFNRLVNFTGPDLLDNILKSTPIPADFDFLCIDVDGNDYHIWDALQLYQPKIVMVEYNGRIPLDIKFVQPADMKIRWGSSLLSIYELGKKKGYELIYAHICNAIFVKKEFYRIFNIVNNHPMEIVEEKMPETRFFQFYDGSIVLHGCPMRKLLCNKKKILVHPVWVLEENGSLRPVKFYQDSKILNFLKKLIRNSFLYHFIYPFVRKFYDQAWEKRKKKIS